MKTDYILKNIFRYILTFTFLISAVLKIVDFQNTVLLLSDIFNLVYKDIKLLLSFLIIIEIFISAAIFKRLHNNTIIYIGVLLTLGTFLVVNILFYMKGMENCGCMGTLMSTTPLFSIIKSIILLVIYVFISKKAEPDNA